MTQRALPCTIMRGGTSKGLYFSSAVLPSDVQQRDRVLLAAMGSPHSQQIDGMGGGHPLTSKVAIVGPPSRDDADVDYLFLQVVVDKAEVSDGQNCGNLLAGVAQFAVDQGLVNADKHRTSVRIHMLNTRSIAVAHISTPDGQPNYAGDASIDGVPGTAAPVWLDFEDVAGSSCGALFPTGLHMDEINGVEVSCVDNGMPVVVICARDVGKTGLETPDELEADERLKEQLEAIRLTAGERMNLGDVRHKTVPKMCLVSRPVGNGVISTRTFIPHRVHKSIGVLGAASVAAVCAIPGTVTDGIANVDMQIADLDMDIEHPTGYLTVGIGLGRTAGDVDITRTTLLRTARKLMSGEVYIPESCWPLGGQQ